MSSAVTFRIARVLPDVFAESVHDYMIIFTSYCDAHLSVVVGGLLQPRVTPGRRLSVAVDG